MPTTGVVIRLRSAESAEAVRRTLAGHVGLELGAQHGAALAGAIEATDYPAHDALLAALRDVADVCAVDIVFHDFSDVQEFPRLPARQRNVR